MKSDSRVIARGCGLLAAILLGGWAGTGCQYLSGRFEDDATRLFAEDELAAELNSFADSFSGRVQNAADLIAERSADRLVRRRALQWKVISVAECRRAVLEDNHRVTYADLLALCVQLRLLFEEGELVFGSDQTIALETMVWLETRIRALSERIFAPVRRAEVLSDTEKFALEHPATAQFRRDSFRLDAVPVEQKNALMASLAIPLKPFRVFEGIDQGAQAISELAQVADRFVSVAQEMPERTRWQMELLSYGLEDLDAIDRTLAGMASLTESSARVAAVAESLPSELRATLDQALADIDRRHEDFDRLLVSARAAIAELNGTTESAEQVATALERVASHLTDAGAAWEGTFSALRDITGKAENRADRESAGTSRPAGPEDEGGGFDVTQYGDAAREIATAGQELRAVLEELNQLLGSGDLRNATEEIDRTARATIDRTGDESRSLADHVAWRLGQLAAFIFGLALVYRLVASRIRGRSS